MPQKFLDGSDIIPFLQYPSFFPSWPDEAKLAKGAAVPDKDLIHLKIDILYTESNSFDNPQSTTVHMLCHKKMRKKHLYFCLS